MNLMYVTLEVLQACERHVDISMNNALALNNAQFIHDVRSCNASVETALAAVRVWARRQRLTGGAHYCSNYTLQLMIIWAMQVSPVPCKHCNVRPINLMHNFRARQASQTIIWGAVSHK